MNGNFRKEARIATLIILLLALAFALSNYSASRAAEGRIPKAGKTALSGAAYPIFQGNTPTNGFIQQDPPGVDPALLQNMRQNAQGPTSVSARRSTGMASFVRASQGGDLLPGAANQRQAPQGKAMGFFAQYGGLFGIRDANSELSQVAGATDQFGATHLEYQQVYNGVPVFAGILRAHTDASGKLTAINGVFVPDINLDTNPALSADAAASKAIADVQTNPPADENNPDEPPAALSASLSAASTTLYVYRDGLIQNVPGPNLLVYEVVVTDGASLKEVVFVNAHSGKVVNRYSATEDALFRRLFEQNTSTQVWQEGDPFPGTLNQDQQNIVNFSGQSYYFFNNAFGRDSFDGAGSEMRSVNNDPTIACPNANWNGATTNYCNGVTSDDVVAHEWGHAYTQFTSNLIYQWQSGALNESYSDIWGEVVDQINGVGTDSPAPTRSANACTSFTPPPPELFINSPAAIAGHYAAQPAQFGPALTTTGVTANVVVANDGSANPTLACGPLVNAAAVSGNIALVDRGTCGFTVKVKNAQNAGAVAVIVGNNQAWQTGGMAGVDATITIPSILVTQSTSTRIKANPGVNATVRRMGSNAEASYLWLVAEDSTAFGAAIRDMWAPNCRAHPGKVSDTEYHCASTDGGGVHRNSGIPNHGFSLLTDGGTYNGQTITGIGLTKAANIYWRAQAVYQTPSTNFADHADALEASCTDLIGANLDALGVGSTDPGPSGQSITAADCGEVSKVIAAVEFRTDPAAQCNFQPILQQNPPAICTTGKPSTFFQEKFNDGLDEWTLTNQGVFSGWPGYNWAATQNLPAGHTGTAAFGIDPDAGNCSGGAGDISGFMSMESRSIKIPKNNNTTLRLAYTHYLASELGWDGGNLKISINGSAYSLVPASAYLFNPYNITLQTAAAGNTDPLAGQPAFSGTDGGKVTGSWGQSQIDLAALGVKPGDTIRLRYDFGMDGCTGIDGWYVDDIQVTSCKVK